MAKYPISKEFYPYAMFAPPVRNAGVASAMGSFLRVPGGPMAYGKALEAAGVPVTFYETEGTVHGYDIVEKAPTTRKAVEERIGFMKTLFGKNKI